MEPTKARITSLDLLRGIVMIIMALDHVRDYVHYDAYLNDPLDLATTSIPLFFTRWITHFCAPVFVFLAGTSIYLQGLRKPTNELGAFLMKRGLWLIIVEVILITFAWTFNTAFNVFILQVIWAIGFGMVAMGVLIRLPYAAILAIGLLIVFGHNVFDGFEETGSGFWWDVLRNGNFVLHGIGSGLQLLMVYPLIPWLGVMMTGYALGALYAPGFDPARRRRLLLLLGTGATALFIILRFLNVYGDPNPWSPQPTTAFTILSFINVQKYPPSLLFLCITIGPSLLFLAAAENLNNTLSRAASVFGRVPLFYYVLHLYLVHLICMVMFLARGHSFSEPIQDVFGLPFRFIVVGEGYSLTVTYLVWIGVVIALYPLCKWFSDYKQKHSYWWLSYV